MKEKTEKETIEISRMDELLTTLKSIDSSLKQIARKINTAPRASGDHGVKTTGDRLFDLAMKKMARGETPIGGNW